MNSIPERIADPEELNAFGIRLEADFRRATSNQDGRISRRFGADEIDSRVTLSSDDW